MKGNQTFTIAFTGTLLLILQLTLVDAASSYLAVNEILLLSGHKNWFLPPELCPLFTGSEVLINCAIIYLLIGLNFHLVSVWNLHESEMKQNDKNPLTSHTDDTNECLVTKHENRLMTIDYRKLKNDISVFYPTVFAWCTSLSLSVPNFTLTSILKIEENRILCSVIEVCYEKMLQFLLLTFTTIIPGLLLLASLVITVLKLSQKNIDNVLTKKTKQTRKLLFFAIFITVAYLLTSFQRHILHFAHVISHSFPKNNIDNFKMPPLYNTYLNDLVLLNLAMLHYFGGFIRGVLYLMVFPNFRDILKNKIFICFKRNT